MAHKFLGNIEEANQRFSQLIAYGEAHKNEVVKWDFFAVSAPEHSVYENDIQLDNHIYCLYLIGLGYLGKGDDSKAKNYFEKVLKLHPAHQGVIRHLSFIK